MKDDDEECVESSETDNSLSCANGFLVSTVIKFAFSEIPQLHSQIKVNQMKFESYMFSICSHFWTANGVANPSATSYPGLRSTR